MSQSRRAKKERSRERERAQARVRRARNGVIALAITGAIGAVIVLGVVAGSGGGSGSGGSTSAGSHELAPDVQISTTSWSGGRTFRLSELRGKPVALYFVAAWCSTCVPETRAWAKIYPEIKEQAEVIIFDIDTNEDENDLLRFKRQAGGADHLWAMDVGNQVARAFDIPVLDATVIIDADGKIAYRDFSPTSEGKLREVLAKLLEVKAGPESNVP